MASTSEQPWVRGINNNMLTTTAGLQPRRTSDAGELWQVSKNYDTRHLIWRTVTSRKQESVLGAGPPDEWFSISTKDNWERKNGGMKLRFSRLDPGQRAATSAVCTFRDRTIFRSLSRYFLCTQFVGSEHARASWFWREYLFHLI